MTLHFLFTFTFCRYEIHYVKNGKPDYKKKFKRKHDFNTRFDCAAKKYKYYLTTMDKLNVEYELRNLGEIRSEHVCFLIRNFTSELLPKLFGVDSTRYYVTFKGVSFEVSCIAYKCASYNSKNDNDLLKLLCFYYPVQMRMSLVDTYISQENQIECCAMYLALQRQNYDIVIFFLTTFDYIFKNCMKRITMNGLTYLWMLVNTNTHLNNDTIDYTIIKLNECLKLSCKKYLPELKSSLKRVLESNDYDQTYIVFNEDLNIETMTILYYYFSDELNYWLQKSQHDKTTMWYAWKGFVQNEVTNNV